MKKMLLLGIIGLLLIAACSEQMPEKEMVEHEGDKEMTDHDDSMLIKTDVGEPDSAVDADDIVIDVDDDAEVIDLSETENIVHVDMIARQWEFEPREIRVKEGDIVDLSITSEDVRHGILIPDFGVNVKFDAGETVNARFTADKKGEFTFYCNVPCGAGHSSMIGQVIVE